MVGAASLLNIFLEHSPLHSHLHSSTTRLTRVTAEQRLETPSGGDGLKVEEGPFARFSESLRQSTQFTASHSDAPHISLNA